jgi:hypothetical protein
MKAQQIEEWVEISTEAGVSNRLLSDLIDKMSKGTRDYGDFDPTEEDGRDLHQECADELVDAANYLIMKVLQQKADNTDVLGSTTRVALRSVVACLAEIRAANG